MRLDKYLKVSRLIKRRTVAAGACDGGRVQVNGVDAKPGKQIKVGDTITIGYGKNPLTVRVKEVRETVGKDSADTLYEVIEG